MTRAIRRTEILTHPAIAIRCLGWHAFWQIARADGRQTFASVLQEAGFAPCDDRVIGQFIARSMKLELRAMQIYEALARVYSSIPRGHEFFATLASHGQRHAEMLEAASMLIVSRERMEKLAKGWHLALPKIGEVLHGVESSLPSLDRFEDALDLVMRIEASDLNRLFSSILTATGSEFVATMPAFRNALRDHVDYLCQELPSLDPANLQQRSVRMVG